MHEMLLYPVTEDEIPGGQLNNRQMEYNYDNRLVNIQHTILSTSLIYMMLAVDVKI